MAIDDDMLESFADKCVSLGGDITKKYTTCKDSPESPRREELMSVSCSKPGEGIMRLSKMNNWASAESWEGGINGLLLEPETVEFHRDVVKALIDESGSPDAVIVKDEKENSLVLASG